MATLNLVITDAGRQAIVDATNTGTLPVALTQVALGSGRWSPDATAIALQEEIKRIDTVGGQVVADDTIHVTITDDSSDSYSLGEFGLYTDNGVLFAIYSDALYGITDKANDALLLLAVDVVLTSVPPGSVVVEGPGFSNPQATETSLGVARIATQAETDAGLDDQSIVTPKKLTAYAQPKDATLSALASVPTEPDQLLYATGSDSFHTTPLTSFARTFLDDGSPEAVRATLQLGSLALQDQANVEIQGGLILDTVTALGVIDRCEIDNTNIGLAYPGIGNFSDLREQNTPVALVQEAAITVTVGPGGNFSSINDALAHLSRFSPRPGIKGKVVLLSGFVMSEQVLIHGDNLGRIDITSQDPEVIIDPSAFSTYQETDLGQITPAFGALAGGTLPHIATTFNFSTLSPGVCGVFAYGSGSSASIGPNFGFLNSVIAVHASCGATVEASGARLINSQDCNIFADQCAVVNARGAFLADCPVSVRALRGAKVVVESAVLVPSEVAILAEYGATVVADQADASFASAYAILADFSAVVEASEIIATGAEIRADRGSTVNAGLTNAPTISSVRGSRVDATQATAPPFLIVAGGAQISATGTNPATNVAPNTITPNGIIFV